MDDLGGAVPLEGLGVRRETSSVLQGADERGQGTKKSSKYEPSGDRQKAEQFRSEKMVAALTQP